MNFLYNAKVFNAYLCKCKQTYSLSISTKAKTPNSLKKLIADFKLPNPPKKFFVSLSDCKWNVFQYRMLNLILFTCLFCLVFRTNVLSLEPIRRSRTTSSLTAPLCGRSGIDSQSGGLYLWLQSVYEMKSLFQYFESSTIQRHYFKVWPVLEKNWRFYDIWKLCEFALKNGLRITRPKCPDDVGSWTRLRDCNTIRHALAIHNINILVVIWRFKESTQFRIARHVLPQKPFLVIYSVHNTTSQDEIEQ